MSGNGFAELNCGIEIYPHMRFFAFNKKAVRCRAIKCWVAIFYRLTSGQIFKTESGQSYSLDKVNWSDPGWTLALVRPTSNLKNCWLTSFLAMVLTLCMWGELTAQRWGGLNTTPPVFSRWLKNDGRFRRETFSTLSRINLTCYTKILENSKRDSFEKMAF